MKHYPYVLTSNELFAEILDVYDKPIMVVPNDFIQQFKMPIRKVYVILYDTQGRILVRTSRKAKILNIPSVNIFAGQAREHAATRIITSILKLNNDTYLEMLEHTIEHYKYTSFFMFLVNSEQQKNLGKKALWLDLDELQGFVTHFTDMLGEDLLNFINEGHFERWLLNSKSSSSSL